MRGADKFISMRRGARRHVWRSASLLCASLFCVITPALAADEASAFTKLISHVSGLIKGQNLTQSFITMMCGAAMIGLGLIAILLRRRRFSSGKNNRSLRELALLEEKLNETEALLLAEPQLLFLWESESTTPLRVTGALHNVEEIPHEEDSRCDFKTWLSADSVDVLAASLQKLRKTGAAFNESVTTKKGTILEADGRPAGRYVSLRLREAAGQRQELAQLRQDYRRLKQQTDAIRAVINNAPMPIWVRDTNGKLNWVNKAYLSAVEALDVKSVVADQIELVTENDKQSATPVSQDSASEATEFKRAHAIVSGNRHALDIAHLDLKNGSAGLAIDMNALEEAQDELKLQMSAHASTLDKLETAVAIFGPDKSLKFFNPAYASLWGLDETWLKSGPKDGEILDRLRAERKLPEQADFKAWKSEVLETYTNLEPYRQEWHLPDSRALSVVAEQHPFGGVTYLFENLTSQFALQSNLNELTSVQRETLNHSQEGVAFFGRGGKLKLHNSAFAKMWQLDENMLKQKPHIDAVIKECRKLFDYEDAWEDLKANVTSIVEKRDVKRARVTRPDGVVLDLSLVPLPDGATLLTYRDMSDSWRTEKALNEKNEALKTADELKTQFLSHMSYQLRTPLTNIIGFAETMDMGIVGTMSDKQKEYVDNILGSSQTLLGIINNILDMASIDAGNIELNKKDVDIQKLIIEALALVSDEVKTSNVQLETDIDPALSTMRADPSRMKQVIYNIVTNALSFSKESGKVVLKAEKDNDNLLLTVTDNGFGMDAEDLKKVFEVFVSRDKGSQRRGTGLGLSLVKSFVELHGGHVEVSSQKGQGTEVTCRIPLFLSEHDVPGEPVLDQAAGS